MMPLREKGRRGTLLPPFKRTMSGEVGAVADFRTSEDQAFLKMSAREDSRIDAAVLFELECVQCMQL